MDWRVLVADSLKAMAVNADVTVVDNGVKIESNEWDDPDWCKYWGVDPWEGWESENSDVEEM